MTEANSTIHDLAGAYAADAVDSMERKTFERHLKNCVDCVKTVADFQSVLSGFSAGASTQPPASLKAQIISSLAEQALATEQKTAQPKPNWFKVVAAATAVAASVLVGAALPLGSNGPAKQETIVAAPVGVQIIAGADDSKHYDMRMKKGMATVYVSAQMKAAAIISKDLPPAPEGKTYQVWYLHQDGSAQSAGLIAAGGTHAALLEGNPNPAVGLGVTLEPLGGSENPSSTPFATISF